MGVYLLYPKDEEKYMKGYQKTDKKLTKQIWFKLDEETHSRFMDIAESHSRSSAYVMRRLVEDFVLRKIDIAW